MMKKTFLVYLLFIMFSGTCVAQSKSTEHLQQFWMAYNNQTRFSKRWGAWLDIHLRTKDDFFSEFSQFIFRPGITYYINDLTKLTVGYGYVKHFPADKDVDVSQPEHRIWQQVQWHTNYKKVKTMQWVRLEERYRREILNDSTLGDGYNFNFRSRYNFLLQVPLSEGAPSKGDFSFILNDEIHINFGKKILYNYFDQNRFFAGFAYHVNSHDNIQFGYLNVFQQLSAGNKYRSINAARVFYFHNLDLSSKKSRL